MSRRRGEFEHRTSIFEGAFRAWSHLGGLEPLDLETKSAAELDPLTNPLENDNRLVNGKGIKGKDGKDEKDENDKGAGSSIGDDENPASDGGGGASGVTSDIGGGGKRREYPYEPLPRSGLAHPFVQAILSPWLGPDADQDAIQLGLTTLRTWWQHRRKGESGSAIAALGTDKMRGVVEGYTRHFFNLAHCLVTNDREQPPRTLHTKMKEVEKIRNKRNKKRAREEEAGKLAALALNAGLAHGLGGSINTSDPAGQNSGEGTDMVGGADTGPPGTSDGLDAGLTPLERLHAAQRRQLAESGGVHSSLPGVSDLNNQQHMPVINVKGKCMPGKIDMGGLVSQVSANSSQLAHRGALAGGEGGGIMPNNVGSADPMGIGSGPGGPAGPAPYGNPNTTPVVFVSENGDIQIAMSIDGITCAHCVKIVETVLRGCNGNKSPIAGLLDAAADRDLCSVLIKIDKSSNAKRIAFEAARNLAMVGYTAKAKEMGVSSSANGSKKIDLGVLSTAFDVVASAHPKDMFDWTIPCTCPDNGVLRKDCARHSQMNTRIFEAFDTRESEVSEYMAGCGMKYGMECTCGPDCTCKNCAKHNPNPQQLAQQQQQQQFQQGGMPPHPQALHNTQMQQHHMGQQAMHQQMMQGGGPGPHNMHSDPSNQVLANSQHAGAGQDAAMPMNMNMNMASRGNSIISFGGQVGRGMSITSETTFGRAMSGLSALSIDWENMEDFDVNVDHSAHIGKDGAGKGGGPNATKDNGEGVMAVHDKEGSMGNQSVHETMPQKRSSIKKSIPIDPAAANNQVSFKI